MARFVLVAATAGVPQPGFAHLYLGPGQTIASDAASARSGVGWADVVWPALALSANASTLAPLDAAGAAWMPGVPIMKVGQSEVGGLKRLDL
jgi:hypothetical protein